MRIDWSKYKNKNFIIYGAHLVALECYRDICSLGFGNHIIGFAVTDVADNPSEIEGKTVREISEYKEYINSCMVVIAMPAKFHIEVEKNARELGFTAFLRISLEDMSDIKGERLIEELPKYTLAVSKSDISWLDIFGYGEHGSIRCKYPTLFYLNDDDLKSHSDKWYESFVSEIGGISELIETHETESGFNLCELNIYMAFDKNVINSVNGKKYDPWEKPLQVGSIDSEIRYGEFQDDQGIENLSDKNRYLAEMTGAFWVWKNAPQSNYKGLCHYRRHFDLNVKKLNNLVKNDVDVVLTTPRFVPGGIRNMFISETPVKESVIDCMLNAVYMVAPEDAKYFEEYIDNSFYFPNNMVVAKHNIYDAYCEWVFPILLKMLELDVESKYGHEFDRHIAYASELLTSFYFIKNKEEFKIFYTDYIFTR